MVNFTPCTLGRNQDGDPAEFFAKTAGFGYNDMISLPTLTKDSILDNLKKRFKVRARRAARARLAPTAGRSPCLPLPPLISSVRTTAGLRALLQPCSIHTEPACDPSPPRTLLPAPCSSSHLRRLFSASPPHSPPCHHRRRRRRRYRHRLLVSSSPRLLVSS